MKEDINISVKEFKKLISQASKYANRHSYMDMDKGICELMVRFHLKMLEENELPEKIIQ